MTEAPTLGTSFGARPNALNLLRLALALLVVVWHSYLFTTPFTALPWPLRQLLEELPVDAFFAVSGLLITRAWLRRPEAAAFLVARASRLLPGLWVCLLVTAFVLAPIVSAGLDPAAQWAYAWRNAAVLPLSGTIEGSGVSAWNVSLWTLGWEVACYLAVCLLGLAGWLRARVMMALAVVCWTFALALVRLGDVSGRAWFDAFPRLGLMFACGSLLWLHRHRIPVKGSVAAVATALVSIGSFLPDYRLVAAPALAYLVVWLGLTLGRWSRLALSNDLSYGVYVYGFPVQQVLLTTGAATTWLSTTALTMVVVLPLAAASWWCVERPALRLRHRVGPWRDARSQPRSVTGGTASASASASLARRRARMSSGVS